ncbi:MAG: 2-hydroxyacyl-CoA dehydratase, partial [Myxococcales bacterium]|nr:2-hydroxyacyl-CoA dehydratase [Myxococcales bacterium]
MSKPAEIVAECEEMVLDMTLARVRSHCEEQGIKAMGHLPVYTPREIVEAAGMLPVGIVGGGDQVEIIRGDAYFQSYICQIPRSVVELGLGKKLDVLSGMVFPATCDVIRNLSGMWKILFPEQFVYYLDVPHNHDVAVGGKFFAHELKRLGQGLTKISGVEITEEALREAIRKRNENRELVSRLYQLRSDSPEKVPTSELYLLLRAGYLLPLAEHNAMLERYLEATEATDRHVLDNARVIVIGTFCEQPPLGLIRTLERAGCYIVDDDLLLGAHFISAQLETSGDPWLTL